MIVSHGFGADKINLKFEVVKGNEKNQQVLIFIMK